MSWWSECPARRLLKEVYYGFRGSFLLSEGDPMLLAQWAVYTVALGGRGFHYGGCCFFLGCCVVGSDWLCCLRELITHFVGCGTILFGCLPTALLLYFLLLRARSLYQHVHWQGCASQGQLLAPWATCFIMQKFASDQLVV